MTRYDFDGPDGPISVEVTATGEDYLVATNGRTYNVKVRPTEDPSTFVTEVSGKPLPVVVRESSSQRVELVLGDEALAYSRQHPVEIRSRRDANVPSQPSNVVITAPLPGKVMDVIAKKGDTVQMKAALVVIESMKMETAVRSDRDGVVEETFVTVGSIVKRGQPLLKFRA